MWQKCVICGLLTSHVLIKLKVISNVWRMIIDPRLAKNQDSRETLRRQEVGGKKIRHSDKKAEVPSRTDTSQSLCRTSRACQAITTLAHFILQGHTCNKKTFCKVRAPPLNLLKAAASRRVEAKQREWRHSSRLLAGRADGLKPIS